MKLDMGRAWNDAIAMLSGNLQVVLILAGVFFFLPNFALTLLMPETMVEVEAQTAGAADFEAIFQALGTAYAEIWWQMLLVSLFSAIGMLSLLALLTDRTRPTVGEALKAGVMYLLSYLGAQIMIVLVMAAIVAIVWTTGSTAGVGAGVLVGLVAFVAAVYIFTKFVLTVPVIVIEGVKNPVHALGRSWSLTKGNSVRLVLFFLLLGVAFIVIAGVVGVIGGVVGLLMGEEGTLIVNSLINAAINMVAASVYLAVLAAVHRQLSGEAREVGATFE